MIDIVQMIREHPANDAIDALYFCIRYIKQAANLLVAKKDIFEEDTRSKPSPAARALTEKIIAAIEADAGEPAANFSRTLVMQVVGELASAAEAIDVVLTPAEEDRATRAMQAMREASMNATEPTSLYKAS